MRMQHHLRQVLVSVNCYTLPQPEVQVFQAPARFDAELRLADETTRDLALDGGPVEPPLAAAAPLDSLTVTVGSLAQVVDRQNLLGVLDHGAEVTCRDRVLAEKGKRVQVPLREVGAVGLRPLGVRLIGHVRTTVERQRVEEGPKPPVQLRPPIARIGHGHASSHTGRRTKPPAAGSDRRAKVVLP